MNGEGRVLVREPALRLHSANLTLPYEAPAAREMVINACRTPAIADGGLAGPPAIALLYAVIALCRAASRATGVRALLTSARLCAS